MVIRSISMFEFVCVHSRCLLQIFYHSCVPPSFSSFSWWTVVCFLGSVLFGHFSFSFLHILCSLCFLSFVTLGHLVGLTNLEFVVVIVIFCLESGVFGVLLFELDSKLVLFIIMAFCFLVFFSCCCSCLLASSWFLCVVDGWWILKGVGFSLLCCCWWWWWWFWVVYFPDKDLEGEWGHCKSMHVYGRIVSAKSQESDKPKRKETTSTLYGGKILGWYWIVH